MRRHTADQSVHQHGNVLQGSDPPYHTMITMMFASISQVPKPRDTLPWGLTLLGPLWIVSFTSGHISLVETQVNSTAPTNNCSSFQSCIDSLRLQPGLRFCILITFASTDVALRVVQQALSSHTERTAGLQNMAPGNRNGTRKRSFDNDFDTSGTTIGTLCELHLGAHCQIASCTISTVILPYSSQVFGLLDIRTNVLLDETVHAQTTLHKLGSNFASGLACFFWIISPSFLATPTTKSRF